MFLKALDSVLLFNIMPAHFAAEGSIAGAMVNGALKIPIVMLSIFQESVLDIPSVINLDHDHGEKEDHEKNNQSVLSVILRALLSVAYSVCLVILGYMEIPDALKVIGINSEQITCKLITLSVLIMGGLSSALVVFNNLYSPDLHEHGELKFFSYFSDKKKSQDDKAEKTRWFFTFSRYSLAFCGAILTSTVGVVIASDLFSIPTWLSGVMIAFAFVVEFKFHETNLKMTKKVFTSIMLTDKAVDSGIRKQLA